MKKISSASLKVLIGINLEKQPKISAALSLPALQPVTPQHNPLPLVLHLLALTIHDNATGLHRSSQRKYPSKIGVKIPQTQSLLLH